MMGLSQVLVLLMFVIFSRRGGIGAMIFIIYFREIGRIGRDRDCGFRVGGFGECWRHCIFRYLSQRKISLGCAAIEY